MEHYNESLSLLFSSFFSGFNSDWIILSCNSSLSRLFFLLIQMKIKNKQMINNPKSQYSIIFSISSVLSQPLNMEQKNKHNVVLLLNQRWGSSSTLNCKKDDDLTLYELVANFAIPTIIKSKPPSRKNGSHSIKEYIPIVDIMG